MLEDYGGEIFKHIRRRRSKRRNMYIFQNIELLYIARLYVVYLLEQQQTTAFASGLIATTLINMHKAINSTGPKIVLYTGHDITLAVLLQAFNFTNAQCIYNRYLGKGEDSCYWTYPSYASTFIFELWQE